MKALIDAGDIGEVRCINATAFRGPWHGEKPWMNRSATSGGGLLAESCHDLDCFHWMLGARAVRVAGFGGTAVFRDQDTLDNIQLVYEFETGVTLSFGFVIFAPGGYRNTVILGSHGRLEYQRHGQTILQYAYEPGDRQAPEPIVHDLSGPMSEAGHVGTDAMYRELISALRERRPPLTSGTEMVESVRMCVAGQEAMLSRQVVTL